MFNSLRTIYKLEAKADLQRFVLAQGALQSIAVVANLYLAGTLSVGT
jgi:hypothetical protein